MKELFGKIGKNCIYKYVLKSENLTLSVLNYGGIIQSLIYNDGENLTDVVLGYNSVEKYQSNDGYFGAIIGRVCNRIDKGKFALSGREYQITLNDNDNALHGGINGFDKKVWFVEEFCESSILFSTQSSDGEEGFPGNVNVKVRYTIIKNSLKIEYFAQSDADTILNMTNHSYFNLNGEGTSDVLGHILKIDANAITDIDEKLIPTGKFIAVRNTPFDFNEYKSIGEHINSDNDILKICGGYDFNYVLNGEGFRKVAEVVGDKSGVIMQTFTDQKGLQLYTGNFLSEREGKSNVYFKNGGFCLETQGFPNAINCKNFPSIVLKKGEKYTAVTEYKFSK